MRCNSSLCVCVYLSLSSNSGTVHASTCAHVPACRWRIASWRGARGTKTRGRAAGFQLNRQSPCLAILGLVPDGQLPLCEPACTAITGNDTEIGRSIMDAGGLGRGSSNRCDRISIELTHGKQQHFRLREGLCVVVMVIDLPFYKASFSPSCFMRPKGGRDFATLLRIRCHGWTPRRRGAGVSRAHHSSGLHASRRRAFRQRQAPFPGRRSSYLCDWRRRRRVRRPRRRDAWAKKVLVAERDGE